MHKCLVINDDDKQDIMKVLMMMAIKIAKIGLLSEQYFCPIKLLEAGAPLVMDSSCD